MLLKAEEIPFELVLINKSFFIIKKKRTTFNISREIEENFNFHPAGNYHNTWKNPISKDTNL